MPRVFIYNAVMGAPGQLLSSSIAHLQAAYTVDVIGAIVVAQVASPAMKVAGFGTLIVTRGGFADHPIPVLAAVSLGKAALRSAVTCSLPTWSRRASVWLPSPSTDRSLPDRPSTLSALPSAIGRLSIRTARGRRSFASPAGRRGALTFQRHRGQRALFALSPAPGRGREEAPGRNRGPSPLMLDRRLGR
jgi:hypothetical protein